MITNAIIALMAILTIVILIKLCRVLMCYWDDEEIIEETITTTTTTETIGAIRRKLENGQYYVIDPIDQKKIWLNDNDDMYEDTDGNIWEVK